MKHAWLFGLIILGQLGYLGGSIGYHEVRVRTGTRILLRTVPVDPFSMFRGRYVALSYEISRIPATLLQGAEVTPGDWVYVSLSPQGEVWEPVRVSIQRPPSGTCLRGQVESAYGGTIHLRYGLESFFLSEPSADVMDRSARGWSRQARERESVTVEVSVARDGTGYARKLFWHGREYR
jgi:uncharacterized membrane-anchored protein